MLDPIQNYIIICLTICRNLDNSKEWKVALYIPKDEVVDALYDQEQR